MNENKKVIEGLHSDIFCDTPVQLLINTDI